MQLNCGSLLCVFCCTLYRMSVIYNVTNRLFVIIFVKRLAAVKHRKFKLPFFEVLANSKWVWGTYSYRTYSCKPNIYVSWSTSELRVRFARRETCLRPPVNYFYLPFQGGASFVDHLCYFCLVLFYFPTHLFIDALRSPAGKGLPSWLSFVISNCVCVTFPCDIMGSGVVLDCIDSWSLPSFLLIFMIYVYYRRLRNGCVKETSENTFLLRAQNLCLIEIKMVIIRFGSYIV